MTLKDALESLTTEQRRKVMHSFNNLEKYLVYLEDEYFLSVHHVPESKYLMIEQSAYFLLGKFE